MARVGRLERVRSLAARVRGLLEIETARLAVVPVLIQRVVIGAPHPQETNPPSDTQIYPTVSKSSILEKSAGKKNAAPELVLTPEELKNGWTPETLAAYFAEREKAHNDVILFRPAPRPRFANNNYSPLRWRGR